MRNKFLTLLKCIPLLALFLFPLFLQAQSQTCVLPDFPNGDTLYLEAGDGNYTGDLTWTGIENGDYYVAKTALKDPDANTTIAADRISIKIMISVKKEQEGNAAVTIKGEVPPGSYYGSLLLKSTRDSSCSKKITLCINTLGAESMATIPEATGGMGLSANTVSGWFLNGILPVKERRNGLAIPLENPGTYPALIDRVVVELVGTNSQEVVRPVVELSKEDRIIHPYQKKMLAVSLKEADLSPDEYTGKVQVYLKNNKQPLDTSVTVNRRCSVLKALFFLLLGIAFGGIYFLVKSKKAQTDSLQKVLRLKNDINALGDEVSKKELLLTVRSLLYQIENAESEEDQASLDGKISALKTAIVEINELEIVYARITEKLGDNPALSGLLNNWRDAILQGDPARKEEAKAAFEQALNTQGGSRSAGGGGVDFGLRRAARIEETAVENKAESKWQQFLTGRFSILFIFTYLRPFVWFISLIILTWVGLQQIYLNGNPAFGAEGLYDYAKLLSWGVFSNIATGSIIDNPLLNKSVPAAQTQEG